MELKEIKMEVGTLVAIIIPIRNFNKKSSDLN